MTRSDIRILRPSLPLNRARILLVLIWLLLLVLEASAQQTYKKQQARHYKSKYKSQIGYYANACRLLDRKKHQAPRASRSYESWTKGRPMAERDYSTPVVAAKKTPEVKPVPEPVAQPMPTEKELETLHTKEDQVLAENKLPVPVSAKHNEIRNKVAEQIKQQKNNEPIELQPLFFNFAEDEFSVVDMDPFLIAVEFALQGKHILIEGHTDNRGADTYNVQLSIKRVKKIQQLMHDMGVPDDRISIMGYGEEHAGETATEKDHQQSRRVDFKAF